MSVIHKLLHYEVRREALDQALALARAYADEVARKEGGTATYKVWHEKDTPTRFTHHAVFRTPSAEEYHRKTAWAKRFHEAIAPLCVAAPREVAIVPLEIP